MTAKKEKVAITQEEADKRLAAAKQRDMVRKH